MSMTSKPGGEVSDASEEHWERYFFRHCGEGGTSEDDEGASFPSLAQAHAEALRSAREMIAEALVTTGNVDWSGRFEITNGSGAIVLVVSYFEAAGLAEWVRG